MGVDITPKKLEVATIHTKEAKVDNVKILENSFDNIDLEDESVDVVISNGAINLTSCKESVFAKIYRVLKPDGQLFFADIIDISEPDECYYSTNHLTNTTKVAAPKRLLPLSINIKETTIIISTNPPHSLTTIRYHKKEKETLSLKQRI